MDIFTQGVVGALAAQALAKKGESRRALWIGFLAGLPADADVFIRSAADPLLTLDYHRQFSHSLLFIPVGGTLVAAVLWPFLRGRIDFSALWRLALSGYATSGLLDACTSFGTQLFWPFSELRVAWSIIAVIDPLFTLTLLLCLFLGWRRDTSGFARLGVILAMAYFSAGILQQGRAETLVREIARQRGHPIERLVVKPTLGNLLLWRVVYRSGDFFHIFAVRADLFSPPRFRVGPRLPVFDIDRPPAGFDAASVVAGDVRRFYRFSDGWLARHPRRQDVLGDVRYAMLPDSAVPLWGIRLDPDRPDRHVSFLNFRDTGPETRTIFFARLRGEGGWQRLYPHQPRWSH